MMVHSPGLVVAGIASRERGLRWQIYCFPLLHAQTRALPECLRDSWLASNNGQHPRAQQPPTVASLLGLLVLATEGFPFNVTGSAKRPTGAAHLVEPLAHRNVTGRESIGIETPLQAVHSRHGSFKVYQPVTRQAGCPVRKSSHNRLTAQSNTAAAPRLHDG